MFSKLFSIETKPGAFFRRIDWTAFWGASLIAFLVYFFTLGPSVGLEDSGELATAADHLGVPHPPGYPFWSLCSWIFCRVFSWVTYMGQPTPAWAVSLFSAVAGAFAAGCTAMLICRSGSDMLDSIPVADDDQYADTAEARTRKNAIMSLAGGLGGSLVFAFSPVEWSQSTIVEIYSLNALFLMAVFLLSYRWMRMPSDKILWLTAFVFGLGLTNYQVLLLAAVPLAIIIALRDIRLFRDFLIVCIPLGLTAKLLQIGCMLRATSQMSSDVINKFEPIVKLAPFDKPVSGELFPNPVACPNEIVLWIGLALVVIAPVAGIIMRRRCSAHTLPRAVLGIGGTGAALIFFAATVFAGTTTWCGPLEAPIAPLITPTKYAVLGAMLAAVFTAAAGSTFVDRESEDGQKLWKITLIASGVFAVAAVLYAASVTGFEYNAALRRVAEVASAGDQGFSANAQHVPFAWAQPTLLLLAGLALLFALAVGTPKGLAFAIPVAAVQVATFILLRKGAMNGLTNPHSWWFFWPIVWNFAMLALAAVTLPNGRSVSVATILAELGVSFYAYMPIVSDLRNPPMNWGYPRTWEGFKHALTRGQYEAIKMPDLVSIGGFDHFLEQMGFYFQSLRMQFTIVAAALALVPFAVWTFTLRLKNRVRPIAVKAVWGAAAIYVAAAALVIAFSSKVGGEVPYRIDKYLLGLLALFAGAGVYLMLRRQVSLILDMLFPKSNLRTGICMGAFGVAAFVAATLLTLCLCDKGFAGGVGIFSIAPATGEMLSKGLAVVPSAAAVSTFKWLMFGAFLLFATEFALRLCDLMDLHIPVLEDNISHVETKADLDDVSQQWLIAVGACFALMSLFLVALANVRGDIQDGFIQKVKFISSHGMFALWIGYGLAVGLVVANRLMKLCFRENEAVRKAVFCVLCVAAACVALIPVYENYTNDRLVFEMGSAEQNGHTFGWQFGNYQLRGANAIREELSPDEEPLPNPMWPEEMEPSSIFFGGTDPGRFVPTYMIYSAMVRPDVYLITQNALADDTYMSVERDLYGDEIWIPAKEDSAESFNIYVSEVHSGKRSANADLKIENGRVQVTGALGVMEINGILSKMMFDHERLRHAFYVEESYVIQWMYPYLTPHGLVMKINPETNKLNSTIVKNDMEFWDWYQRRLLRDSAFRRDFPAQKSFSKLRAAIAGLYANNGLYTMADQAFREAVLLYPASPEATFRYIQEVLLPMRKWDSVRDLLDYTDRVDPNNKRTSQMSHYLQSLIGVSTQIDGLTAKAAKGPLSAADSIRLAQCYQKVGQNARALETTRNTILMPDAQDFDVLFLAAHIFSTCGMRGDAATTMQRALGLMPDNLDPYYRRAMAKIFMEGGLNAEAESTLNALLQIQPRDADALLDRAIVRDNLGQTQAAMGDLVSASQINREVFEKRIRSSEKLVKLMEMVRRLMSRQPQQPSSSPLLPAGY